MLNSNRHFTWNKTNYTNFFKNAENDATNLC